MASIGIDPHGKGALTKKAPPRSRARPRRYRPRASGAARRASARGPPPRMINPMINPRRSRRRGARARLRCHTRAPTSAMETLWTRSHIPRMWSHIPRTRTRTQNPAAPLPPARSRTIRDVAASLGIASRRRARPADGVILHYYDMMFTCSLTTYFKYTRHRARGVRARTSSRSGTALRSTLVRARVIKFTVKQQEERKRKCCGARGEERLEQP